jgi:hypothetical protein
MSGRAKLRTVPCQGKNKKLEEKGIVITDPNPDSLDRFERLNLPDEVSVHKKK